MREKTSGSDQPPDRGLPAGRGTVTYRQEYRRCGKKTCSRCGPGRPGHGPYWYASWWEKGRHRTRYIGKDLPPGVEATPASPPAIPLQVWALGGFAVHRGETLLAWPSRRAAALFKCLLSAPGHRLTRDQAIEFLWPGTDPDLGGANLRTTIHLLRQTLDTPGTDTRLRTEGGMLVLTPGMPSQADEGWLDAEEFERRARDALVGDDADACRRALDLYGGEYLPEDLYEPWTEPTRGRLERLHVDLLQHLAHLAGGQGDLEEAERCLRQVLEADSGDEEAAAELMSLLAASGRADRALRVYQELAATLEEELDVAPGADIEELRARIIAQRGVRSAPALPETLEESKRANLPAPVTSFIGRAWEQEEICRLLCDARLVTLTGPGGCGKTRLAIEVARTLVEGYADGVWLVELGGVADPALVPSVVAGTLGVEEQANVPVIETLRRAWSEREALLVLDNCEHLVDACADLVDSLLSGSPLLRILATGREALQVAGEVIYYLPSLAAPDPERRVALERLAEYEAVALFVDRARERRPAFNLTATNASAVAQICARLDGLPLAIELAAARLSILPVEGIAQRLDDRFRLLAGGPRTALPRQQTLRATMEWSHSLLTDREKALFRRLAVFAGGWTLEAAEAVCAGEDLSEADVLDHLDGLVHKSLVAAEDHVGGAWYRMLETIRQFAHEKLVESGEERDLRHRHASHFAAFVERAATDLAGREEATWIRRLQADLDNIRSAVAWARECGAIELGLRVVAPIWGFWMVSGQVAEGRRSLESLMAQCSDADVSDVVQAAALWAAGSLAYIQGEAGVARHLYSRCLELRRALGDAEGIAQVLNGLGLTRFLQGEYTQAEHWFEEAIQLWREIGDAPGMHAPLINLANIARYRGDYRRAIEMYEQALAIQRQMGHTSAVVTSLDNLSQVWGLLGNHARGEVLAEEALALAREIGAVSGIVQVLGSRGSTFLEEGRYADAEACLGECLELARSSGEQPGESQALVNLAEIAKIRGDLDRARELARDALAIARQLDLRRMQGFALLTLADTARLQGEHETAAAHLEECLALRRDMGDAVGIAAALEARARLAGAQRRARDAVRAYGAAAALRAALETPLPPNARAWYDEDLSHLHAEIAPAEFTSLWGEGRAMASSFAPFAEQIIVR